MSLYSILLFLIRIKFNNPRKMWPPELIHHPTKSITDQLTYWLNKWQTDRLTDWPTEWLTHWVTDLNEYTHSPTHPPSNQPINQSINQSIDVFCTCMYIQFLCLNWFFFLILTWIPYFSNSVCPWVFCLQIWYVSGSFDQCHQIQLKLLRWWNCGWVCQVCFFFQQ